VKKWSNWRSRIHSQYIYRLKSGFLISQSLHNHPKIDQGKIIFRNTGFLSASKPSWT